MEITKTVTGFIEINTEYKNIATVMNDMCDVISEIDCGSEMYNIEGTPISLEDGVLTLEVIGHVTVEANSDEEANKYIQSVSFGDLTDIDWD